MGEGGKNQTLLEARSRALLVGPKPALLNRTGSASGKSEFRQRAEHPAALSPGQRRRGYWNFEAAGRRGGTARRRRKWQDLERPPRPDRPLRAGGVPRALDLDLVRRREAGLAPPSWALDCGVGLLASLKARSNSELLRRYGGCCVSAASFAAPRQSPLGSKGGPARSPRSNKLAPGGTRLHRAAAGLARLQPLAAPPGRRRLRPAGEAIGAGLSGR